MAANDLAKKLTVNVCTNSLPIGEFSRRLPSGASPRPKALGINQELYFWVIFQNDPLPCLDEKNEKGTMFLICSHSQERQMFKIFVEEAAALASITLFVGMIAVWAQVIPQL